MATANDLKTAIAAYMHRDASVFVTNGFDVLVRAMNNARLFAERKVDFELSRVTADVTTSVLNGGALSAAVLHSDGITPVRVKKITSAFLAFTTGGFFPIGIISRNLDISELKRQYEGIKPTDNPASAFQGAKPFRLVQLGSSIYITPADTTTLGTGSVTVSLDVFKFLPDYGATLKIGTSTTTTTNKLVASAGSFITNLIAIGNIVTNTTSGASAVVTAVESATTLALSGDIFLTGNAYSIATLGETDFLIDNCFDWLMYRSAYELNFYLKEDERVTLAARIVDDAWSGLLSWNANMVTQGVDDNSLD